MRQVLAAFMAYRDENAYDLEDRSTVPQATINRYLTGKHKNLSVDNAKKIASAYGLSVSQFRGDVPLSREQQIQLLNGSKKQRHHLMVKHHVLDPLQIKKGNPSVTDELIELHAFIEEFGHVLERDSATVSNMEKTETTSSHDSDDSAPLAVVNQLSADEEMILNFFKRSGQEVKDAMLRMAGQQSVISSTTDTHKYARKRYPLPDMSTGRRNKTKVR